jgi:hypothetical protein
MLKSSLTIFHFFLVTILSAQHTIRIKVDSLPLSSRQYDLYIAGSFNNWNPGNDQYKFQPADKGKFNIDLKLFPGSYEYKITRGSWKEVECTSAGADITNRVLNVYADENINIKIAGWKDNFQNQPVKHSACSHVKIIDTAFLIPQLNRTRRIWIYLPEGYANTKTNYRYPVLFMHDGQNVFDDGTSFAGEWGVDEFLDSTKARSCIVVAIDNGGSKRLNEYCPYDFTLAGISSLTKGKEICMLIFL